MKEITILSGKGGTGKTSVTAAFGSLAKNAVFCDNDVDAADLHLILQPEIKENYVFSSGWSMGIDNEKCTSCGLCKEKCRFEAIHIDNFAYYINDFQCEGCRLCERICPVNAIKSEEKTNNAWYVSDTRMGKLVHAKMGPGEENSGRLVTEIRKKAKSIAKEENNEIIINDGPPGIGCAAIASVSGTGKVVLVTEPSKSGMHDLKRLMKLVTSFNIPMMAIINKYNINAEISDEISSFLKNLNIPLIAKIPYSEDFVSAMVAGKSIVEYKPDSEITAILSQSFKRIVQID